MSTPAPSLPVEPFVAYLRRRGASSTALTPGEVVTATVGLLRGCRQAAGRYAGASWWLTAAGRPVVVEERDAPDVVAATSDSLVRLADLTPDPTTRDLVARAREVMSTRPPRQWDAVERTLFSHAEPTPLVLGPLTPVSDAPSEAPRPPAPPSGALALLDAELVETVRRTVAGVRDRWQASVRFRAGAVGAASLALVVIGAAVFVPDRPDPVPLVSPTAAVGGAMTPSSSPTPSASAIPSASATSPWPVDDRVPLSDDLVVIARDLFARTAACGDDAGCRDAFDEASTFDREPLLDGAQHADITVLEDFGGVAAVRVADGEVTQYVTLVRQNDRWLVRAVETVTDQPS